MNRPERFREIIKNWTIVLLLLLVTLLAVELPKQWYSRADEGLLNHVTIDDYSVSVVKEPMNLEQKLNALISDDCIVVGDKYRLNEEEKQNFEIMLADEVYQMLDYGWEELIMNLIYDPVTDKRWRRVQIIQVIDNKILSFDLGSFVFANIQYDMPGPGLILFDMETGEILYMRVYSYQDIYNGYVDFTEAESSFIYDASENYGITYGEEDWSAAQAPYYAALSEYYGIEISEDSEAYISEGVIIASPFTKEDVYSETFMTIEDYIMNDFKSFFH